MFKGPFYQQVNNTVRYSVLHCDCLDRHARSRQEKARAFATPRYSWNATQVGTSKNWWPTLIVVVCGNSNLTYASKLDSRIFFLIQTACVGVNNVSSAVWGHLFILIIMRLQVDILLKVVTEDVWVLKSAAHLYQLRETGLG